MSEGRITLYIAASVDGFIATEDGGVSWLEPFEQEDEGDHAGRYEAFFDSVDCLVMGSKTYEQVLEFGEWPYETKPTYVVTHRTLPRATDTVKFFDGDIAELADQLRQRYEHVWVVGGAQLAQSFRRQNQIDELWLNLVPVLLGRGISLFDDADETRDLKLIETTTHENGIVELRYEIERGSNESM